MRDRPASVVVLDLRTNLDHKRVAIENSINIPFSSVSLKEPRLDGLNVPKLKAFLRRKVVVIVSPSHENALLFAKFLVDCHVSHVCVLNRGFEFLYRIDDKLMMQTFDYINTLAKNVPNIANFVE